MPSKAEIEARMDLNNKGFRSKLKQGNAQLTKFGKSVTKVANKLAKMGLAAAAGSFALLSRNAIAFGSAQSDVAAQLDIDTVKFQTYSGAIQDAGGTMEQMRKSILSQQQAVVQGSEGLTTFTRAFDRLGLNVHDLRKQKPEEQFELIADAVANAKDQQGALTAVSEIYGKRNAPELIEVMQRLSRDGFQQLSKDIRETYGIMDAETQAALDKAADTIEQFKQRATIKVGELIAGESDGAAIKELGFQLMSVAAGFGGKMVDGIVSLGQVIKAGIGGSLEFVASEFMGAMEGTIDSIRIKFGKVMIEVAEKNPLISTKKFSQMLDAQYALEDRIASRRKESAEETKKTWKDFFNDSIPEPTDYAGELAGYWTDLANEQRTLLEEARKAGDEIEKTRSGSPSATSPTVTSGSNGGAGSVGAQRSAARGGSETSGADANGDGITTGREERAAERAARKAATEQRRRRTAAVAAESRAGLEMDQSARAARMSAREAAAGLSGTLTGRESAAPDAVPAPSAQQRATESAAANQESSPAEWQKDITLIREDLDALKGAIS